MPSRHILEGHFSLILANAAQVKNAPGRKSDVNDATWLSDLLAHGLIRGSFVPPEPIQEMRDLTRTRKQLTRELVGLRSRPPKLLRRDGKHQPISVKKLAFALPSKAWRNITWREATAEPLSSRFARVRVRVAHRDYWLAESRPEDWR